MDVAERAARGGLRPEASRSAQDGAWAPGEDRADPVAILEAPGGLAAFPQPAPIRDGRMSACATSGLLRRAAAVMSADLAGTPVSGLRVQACGDAHLSNFGACAAPHRRLVLSIFNDFPATPLLLVGVGRQAARRQLPRDRRARERARSAKSGRGDPCSTAVRTYREAMRAFASRPTSKSGIPPRRRGGDGGDRSRRPKAANRSQGSREGTSRQPQGPEEATEVVDGELRIRSELLLLVPGGEELVGAEQVVIGSHPAGVRARRSRALDPSHVSARRLRDVLHRPQGGRVWSVGTRAGSVC